ncbi:MAG: hypothetical protein ACD_76C00130G0007 [uncultured bacterium]|nr:MAG: hypothetical protein ACD_76C00130G0007 [uncultured bacterium]
MLRILAKLTFDSSITYNNLDLSFQKTDWREMDHAKLPDGVEDEQLPNDTNHSDPLRNHECLHPQVVSWKIHHTT